MKPYIIPKPVVVVDMQTALRALTTEDFGLLVDAWLDSLHETYQRGMIGASVDIEEKVLYVTFNFVKDAHGFQVTAQDTLDRAVAFFMKPREMPLSVDEQLGAWLSPDGVDPSDPSLPE